VAWSNTTFHRRLGKYERFTVTNCLWLSVRQLAGTVLRVQSGSGFRFSQEHTDRLFAFVTEVPLTDRKLVCHIHLKGHRYVRRIDRLYGPIVWVYPSHVSWMSRALHRDGHEPIEPRTSSLIDLQGIPVFHYWRKVDRR
jgi:hypothetical protein